MRSQSKRKILSGFIKEKKILRNYSLLHANFAFAVCKMAQGKNTHKRKKNITESLDVQGVSGQIGRN